LINPIQIDKNAIKIPTEITPCEILELNEYFPLVLVTIDAKIN
jgi:hypothetical protein